MRKQTFAALVLLALSALPSVAGIVPVNLDEEDGRPIIGSPYTRAGSIATFQFWLGGAWPYSVTLCAACNGISVDLIDQTPTGEWTNSYLNVSFSRPVYGFYFSEGLDTPPLSHIPFVELTYIDETTSDFLLGTSVAPVFSYWGGQPFDNAKIYFPLTSGLLYSFAYNDVQVPEPATTALMGAGLLGLAALRRKQRR